MTFEVFERAIAAEPLKQVARHWNAVRGDRPMPGWRDIRPSAIVAQLPILWSWKYNAADDSFTGRLAGDAIEAIIGKSLRGAAMTDIFGSVRYQAIFDRLHRVVTGPFLFHGHGLVFRHLDRYGTGERIILPLSDGGNGADGIVGATVYETATGAISPELVEAGEAEEWFALD